jgi:hypothetical protein
LPPQKQVALRVNAVPRKDLNFPIDSYLAITRQLLAEDSRVSPWRERVYSRQSRSRGHVGGST